MRGSEPVFGRLGGSHVGAARLARAVGRAASSETPAPFSGDRRVLRGRGGGGDGEHRDRERHDDDARTRRPRHAVALSTPSGGAIPGAVRAGATVPVASRGC